MTRVAARFLGICLPISVALLPSVFEQGPIELSANGICRACTLSLRELATLGKDTADGYLTDYPVDAVMDRQSRIYVTLQPPGDLVLTFDSTGRFLGRIGRKGRGPGEFVFPVRVLARDNGELLIWDFNAAMLTTLDASLRYLRRRSQPNAPAAIMPDGKQVVVSAMFDDKRIGYPLHYYDVNGKLTSSFGETGRSYTDADRWRLARAVSVSPRGTVWAAHSDAYVIEEWDNKPTRLRVFRRTVSWMPPVNAPSDGVWGDRPNAKIMTLFERDGLLWVFSRIPAREWQRALGQPSQRPGRRASYPKRNQGALFDTMVDVIDVSSNTLLLSQRLNMHVRFTLRHGVVAAYAEEAAVPLLKVLRFGLQRPGRE